MTIHAEKCRIIFRQNKYAPNTQKTSAVFYCSDFILFLKKYGAAEKTRTSTGYSPTSTSSLRVYHSATAARDNRHQKSDTVGEQPYSGSRNVRQ